MATTSLSLGEHWEVSSKTKYPVGGMDRQAKLSVMPSGLWRSAKANWNPFEVI
jgi:hypothetical protein